jgi:hypothetical protein
MIEHLFQLECALIEFFAIGGPEICSNLTGTSFAKQELSRQTGCTENATISMVEWLPMAGAHISETHSVLLCHKFRYLSKLGYEPRHG